MKPEDVCELDDCLNQKAVKEVQSKMPKNETFLKTAEGFKILSDPTRIKILFALSQRELCVCDLAELLEMTHSAISHQLRIMRTKNLVKFRKDGKNVFYSLTDEHVKLLMEMGIEHSEEYDL